MEFKLTYKVQINKKCKDNKSRSFRIYFLNDIQILKQKLPYDETYDLGFQHRTSIKNEYLLNGNIHQTRIKKGEIRNVSFPASKNKLSLFNIPKDLIINVYENI